jgi:hypothetical protein
MQRKWNVYSLALGIALGSTSNLILRTREKKTFGPRDLKRRILTIPLSTKVHVSTH